MASRNFVIGVDIQGESNLDGAVGSAESTLMGLTGTAAAVTVGVAGAAAAGIGLIGKAAFDVASDFENSQALMQTQLGLTADEAAGLGQVVEDVFGNNFGESIDEATAAVVAARQQFAGMANEELTQVTQQALAMSDAFDTEFQGTLNATNTLMNQFGLNSQEAMAFIQQGFQNGLNTSGDFLESINEYSTQFSAAGATADEFWSIMETGMQGGVLGTDKAADMFKEFRLRITEADSATVSAMDNLFALADFESGFTGAGGFFEAMETGAITGGEAFSTILNSLQSIEDPLQRQQLAVQLLGTQFEDLGDAAFEIDPLSTVVTNQTDDLGELNAQYDTLANAAQGFGRQALIAIKPLGDALLVVANAVLPIVSDGFAKLMDVAGPVIEQVAANIVEFVEGIDFEQVVSGIMDFGKEVGKVIGPVIKFVTENFKLSDVLIVLGGALMTIIVPAVIGFLQTFAPVIGIIMGAIAVVAGLRTAWENDFGGIRSTLTEVWTGTLLPAFQEIRSWLGENIPVAISMLSGLWTNTLQPAFAQVSEFIKANVAPVLGGLLSARINFLKTTAMAMGNVFINTILPAFISVIEFVVNNVIPVMLRLGGGVIGAVKSAVQGLARIWETSLKPALTLVVDTFNTQVVPALQNLSDSAMPILEAAVSALASVWENSLQPALETVWGIIQDNVLPVFEDIATFVENTLSGAISSFASGALQTLVNILNTLAGLLDTVAAGINTVANSAGNVPGGLAAPGALAGGAGVGPGALLAASPGGGGGVNTNIDRSVTVNLASSQPSNSITTDLSNFEARYGGGLN